LRSSFLSVALSALSACGRLRRTMPTRPRRSTMMVCVLMAVLGFGSAGMLSRRPARGKRVLTPLPPNAAPDVAQALRRDHAELGQMPAQTVTQPRTLAPQPLPATVQQHGSLLVSRLDRHKAHRRAPNRLADRFGIGGIVLVALDVRLHVLRRHQSHLV